MRRMTRDSLFCDLIMDCYFCMVDYSSHLWSFFAENRATGDTSILNHTTRYGITDLKIIQAGDKTDGSWCNSRT